MIIAGLVVDSVSGLVGLDFKFRFGIQPNLNLEPQVKFEFGPGSPGS